MEVRSARNRDTKEADFCEKKLWKHYCIKSQNDRTKKMSSLLRPEADCVCCKDTAIDPEETKGFKLP